MRTRSFQVGLVVRTDPLVGAEVVSWEGADSSSINTNSRSASLVPHERVTKTRYTGPQTPRGANSPRQGDPSIKPIENGGRFTTASGKVSSRSPPWESAPVPLASLTGTRTLEPRETWASQGRKGAVVGLRAHLCTSRVKGRWLHFFPVRGAGALFRYCKRARVMRSRMPPSLTKSCSRRRICRSRR